MDFFKFVWLLKNQCLWLSRSDLLGDPWEVSLSGEQLQLVISRHPPVSLGRAPESAVERAERILNKWRRCTFVNCWNMSEHESNALWSIYCKEKEGVLIQTSIEKLNQMKGEYLLQPVEYVEAGSNKRTPTHADLATKKRPMFSYENEIRIFHLSEQNEEDAKGVRLKFNFSNLIESVRVHPKADDVFYETVQELVGEFAPDFKGTFAWSDMKLQPPF